MAYQSQANNAIKLAKKLYISDNLEASKGNLRKTWNVINELTSRNSGKSTNILEIKVDNKIASNPMDIAEIKLLTITLLMLRKY